MVTICLQFDLGMVYDEPEKSFIHKWLLLTDPEDPSSGAKVTPHNPPTLHLSSPTSSFTLLPLFIFSPPHSLPPFPSSLPLSLHSISPFLSFLSPLSLPLFLPPLSSSPSSLSPLSLPYFPLSLSLLYLTQGYLKISINVIGPGDDPKPSPSTLTQESVDIES